MAKITHEQHMRIVKAFDTFIMASRAEEVFKIVCGIRKELGVDLLHQIKNKDFDLKQSMIIILTTVFLDNSI